LQLKQDKMTFNILKEKDNHLFSRKEIQIEIHAEITPNKSDILNMLSKKFSVPEENIKVKKINGRFGSKEFIIDINIYKSKEDKDNTEIKTQKQAEAEKKTSEEARNAKAEEKKKAKEEKNAEEKTE